MNTELKNKIEQIVSKGAAIVSFDYTKDDGSVTRRNVTIGYQPFGSRAWGQHVSRAIVTSAKGEHFLTAKTNNDGASPDGHCFKSFNLAKISNFTFKGVSI